MLKAIQQFFPKLIEIECVEASLLYDKETGDFDIFLYDEQEDLLEDDELTKELLNLISTISSSIDGNIQIRIYPSKKKVLMHYTE